MGVKTGIVYGLGGHDHYVGLYAVRKLYGSSDLFYDSMGSSSVLAMVKADGEKNCGAQLHSIQRAAVWSQDLNRRNMW